MHHTAVRGDLGPGRRRAAGDDATGVLLSGLGFGLILAVVPMALVNHWAPGVLVTNERIKLMVLGMLLGAGTAAFRHRRTLWSRVPAADRRPRRGDGAGGSPRRCGPVGVGPVGA